MPNSQGGAYQPAESYTRTGGTDTGGTYASGTFTAPAISNAAITGTGSSMAWQVAAMTSTGTTGTDCAAITASGPALITVTGASGAGIGLPTGPVGAFYMVKNLGTGVTKVYGVGSTIDGTTGTTAISITTTGTTAAGFGCTAAGVWMQMPKAT